MNYIQDKLFEYLLQHWLGPAVTFYIRNIFIWCWRILLYLNWFFYLDFLTNIYRGIQFRKRNRKMERARKEAAEDTVCQQVLTDCFIPLNKTFAHCKSRVPLVLYHSAKWSRKLSSRVSAAPLTFSIFCYQKRPRKLIYLRANVFGIHL